MEIFGLTKKQHKIADKLWNFESIEDIKNYIKSLKTFEERRETHVIYQLMVMAILDEAVDNIKDERYVIAEDMLSKIL